MKVYKLVREWFDNRDGYDDYTIFEFGIFSSIEKAEEFIPKEFFKITDENSKYVCWELPEDKITESFISDVRYYIYSYELDTLIKATNWEIFDDRCLTKEEKETHYKERSLEEWNDGWIGKKISIIDNNGKDERIKEKQKLQCSRRLNENKSII